MTVSASQTQLVDPTNATNKRDVQSAVVEGRTIELRVGEINGVQYAWTRLTNAHVGDVIWINMTTDGGQTWKSYGEITVKADGRNYTNALPTSSSSQVKMQAWTQLTDGKKYNTAAW